MNKKIVADWKSTFIDFPDVSPSIVLFMQGCNLNCFYCHAQSLIPTKEAKYDIYEAMVPTEKYKGVVISGGEPTLHGNLLAGLCLCLKANGKTVKLNTNGSCSSTLKLLLDNGLIDYVSMDVKAPLDSNLVRAICCINNEDVANYIVYQMRLSLEYLIRSNINLELRFPISHRSDHFYREFTSFIDTEVVTITRPVKLSIYKTRVSGSDYSHVADKIFNRFVRYIDSRCYGNNFTINVEE